MHLFVPEGQPMLSKQLLSNMNEGPEIGFFPDTKLNLPSHSAHKKWTLKSHFLFQDHKSLAHCVRRCHKNKYFQAHIL